MSNVPHMNLSHITRTNESCTHFYAEVETFIATQGFASVRLWQWQMERVTNIDMSHVTRMNPSCHTHHI